MVVAEELAKARTFCQLSDVKRMQNAGLALGGSLNNAVVVDGSKILNEDGLRMEREFVRHKALDCLGDLMLLGMPINGRMTAFRPGHTLSIRLAQELLDNSDAFKIDEHNTSGSISGSYVMPDLARCCNSLTYQIHLKNHIYICLNTHSLFTG